MKTDDLTVTLISLPIRLYPTFKEWKHTPSRQPLQIYLRVYILPLRNENIERKMYDVAKRDFVYILPLRNEN